jgi:hypothetical protein
VLGTSAIMALIYFTDPENRVSQDRP